MPRSEYGPSTYGDRIAAVYDRWEALPEDAADAAEFLASVAGKGPALELGIGTGRVAIPLSERGVDVHGIDASEAMVAKLRAKPGGREIPVTIGDFAGVDVTRRYQLIFVVFNTFFALLTQEDQVRCFAGVAEHLEETGVFVMQAFVPDLTLFNRGSRVAVTDLEVDKAKLDLARLDPAAQEITSQHVVLEEGRSRPIPSSCATPGHPSWTSWPAWRACGSANGGAGGTAGRLKRAAASTFRCTRSRAPASDYGRDRSSARILRSSASSKERRAVRRPFQNTIARMVPLSRSGKYTA